MVFQEVLNMNSGHFQVLFILGRLTNGCQRLPESHREPSISPLYEKKDFTDFGDVKNLEIWRMFWIIPNGITVSL